MKSFVIHQKALTVRHCDKTRVNSITLGTELSVGRSERGRALRGGEKGGTNEFRLSCPLRARLGKTDARTVYRS